jgi:pyrophosphatase PpaX
MNPPTPILERLRALDAVLFDLDGTLLDTIPHILASFRHATTAVLGAPLSDDVLLRHVGVPLAKQMRMLVDDEDTAERLLVAYQEFNRTTHDEMARLYPGTRETLLDLGVCGPPLAVVTSKGSAMAFRGLELFDLLPFFSAVVTADDTPLHKPDPHPVLHAAHALDAQPARCLYVGDSPHDIEAGRAAGALTAAAAWGVSTRERLEQADPDVIIEDIRDVVGLVCGEGRLQERRRCSSALDRMSVAPVE